MSDDQPQQDREQPSSTAVIGAGSIGAAFAVVFASAGHPVAVFDTEATALTRAQEYMLRSLHALARSGLLREAVDKVLARIHLHQDLASAVVDAAWIHECVPERLDLKRQLFQELERLAKPEAILASASSAIPASHWGEGLNSRERCLVAHPGNPPFLLRILELVPAAFTAPQVLARARQFSTAVGLEPIVVQQEPEGFVFNRLQGALLRGAYCLVRDGVASVDDIDRLVRKGLGLRWSVIGPFETADLNTRGGIAAHAEKLGPAYARMGRERGQDDPWTPELVAQVTAQRRALLPLEQWSERVAWRDRRLMERLAAASEHTEEATPQGGN